MMPAEEKFNLAMSWVLQQTFTDPDSRFLHEVALLWQGRLHT